jgi:hypothetical protein
MTTGRVAMDKKVERNISRLACLVSIPSCCPSMTGTTAEGKDTPRIRMAFAVSLIGSHRNRRKKTAGMMISLRNDPSQAMGSLKISLILLFYSIAPV